MIPATPLQAGPDADVHQGQLAAASPSRIHDAWRVLWAAPPLVMVALRIPAPDAWVALALLVASVAVLNADGVARCARRLSKRPPARREDSGERTGIA